MSRNWSAIVSSAGARLAYSTFGSARNSRFCSSSRVATLADRFARTWRRPPTEQELQGLVEDYVREEILYREGRAAGLDRDDFVIRRRVRQKMEFLAEDMAAAEPSEEQLAAYLASNQEKFLTDDRLTFHQVFPLRKGCLFHSPS